MRKRSACGRVEPSASGITWIQAVDTWVEDEVFVDDGFVGFVVDRLDKLEWIDDYRRGLLQGDPKRSLKSLLRPTR